MTQSSDLLELPSSLRIISLNCWGLKFISKHRHERLVEIGRQLATASPAPTIVGLQECWTQEDYLAIRAQTKAILPHGKFYWSGFFGGGLAILSKWPIEESGMYRYPLNGRPAAFYRGDWFVGKGVACARIRVAPGTRKEDVVEVFCTHLHAPYEQEPNDSYICHRVAQAWEIARLMRHAAERGHTVLGLGDFNMEPAGFEHVLVEAHSPARDLWRVVRPGSAVGAWQNAAERARGEPVPTAERCLLEHGATCDSCFNTWRWSEQMRKDLGKDGVVDPKQPDPRARRLDYIFLSGPRWKAESVEVGMTMRHPTLGCSLSDHFSVETTLVRQSAAADATTTTPAEPPMVSYLPLETYDQILAMIATYSLRERKQRRLRTYHFLAQIGVAIGCLVAVWWSPRNFVAFILMLVSTVGLSAGVLDGLMGWLFVKGELRALKEFEFEVANARDFARRSRAGDGKEGV